MLHDIHEDRLVAILSVSNTPGYMIRNFRQDPAVDALVKLSTYDELRQALKDILDGTSTSVHDGAIAYAYLIAMSVKDAPRTAQMLANGEFRRLGWAEQVVSYELVRMQPTTIAELKVPTLVTASPSQTSNTLRTNQVSFNV